MIEEKRKMIATLISKQSINPQTNTPHPVDRILNAMEIAKVQVDLYKSAEEQVDDVLQAIQRVLPIRFEKIELQIKVPAMHAGKCYGVLKEYGKMKREEWLSDGSFVCRLEIPAGIQPELFDRLNKITHGDIVINQVK
jgi:ribosome maturation protein SDO1